MDGPIKCDYCGGTNVKKVAWKEDKIFCVECLDSRKDGNWCKYTTIPQIEPCPICGKEFEFRFDPGWNEKILCGACRKKAMDDYFSDPEFQKTLKEEMLKRSFILEKTPKENAWTGEYIPVPFKLKEQ